ncbi:hypothetical protein VU04_02000 [Desulfobulbus sp. TB]|nr:hypothetical protein [Desulfobulbus sp. TB]
MKGKTTLKTTAATFFICALYISTAFAGHDRKHKLVMLKAAKDVEYLSQKIAKAYFYRQQEIRPDAAAEDLKKGIVRLRKNLIIIQEGIDKRDREEENVAVFLDYTYNELKNMLNKPYTRDNGALIIDYSESLMEGGSFIAQGHRHKNSPEEVMLVTVEHMLYLLERINKLYIAYQAEFHDYTNVTQLRKAVKEFDTNLSKVNAYMNYSDNALKNRDKLNDFWPVAQEFFLDLQKGALPIIVLASAKKLQNELNHLDNFHHKAANK